MSRRASWVLAGLVLTACGRPESTAPDVASGDTANAMLEATQSAAPEVADCPAMEVHWRSAALWEDAPAFLEALPIGVYVRAGEDVFEVSHLFAGTVDSRGAPEVDLDTYFDIGYTAEVDPGYRRDGACDRLVIDNEIEEHRVEAFLALRGGALALYDSLGAPLGILASVGAPTASGADLQPLPAAPPPPVRLDASGANGPTLATARGRIALAEVFPHGRWFARPAGVRFRGSDLVLVNTCDPYSTADGFCGFENDGERPLADPWSPLVTYVAVRAVEGGGAVEVTPFGSALGGSPLPGLPPDGPVTDAVLTAHTRTLRAHP